MRYFLVLSFNFLFVNNVCRGYGRRFRFRVINIGSFGGVRGRCVGGERGS